ncbi:zinc finger bed domain-containing protein 1-like [Gigaspora margarita]|uniref:Zinc finger bed domain-containing protein 1-like n=1 Tax=Gigaspora margarita TaxID=4874 RepID=A0A8H4AZP7_GIGMA|nr:zinc finger bed domain-containing protein 1-like [Gigaspora margarita]
MIMDNGASVKAAITQILNKILLSKLIVNIFSAVHILQLSINTSLDTIHNLIVKCKAIIQRLGREKKCGDLLELYVYGIKRLTKLERPIKWLVNDLENSSNIEHQCDGSNIREKMLSNNEFQDIHDLVDLLYPFDKVTEILPGFNYATLCIIVPTIEKLVNCFNNINSESSIINEVKDTILDNLSSRWSPSPKYGLFAFFLDLRFKNLSFCSTVSIK